MCAVRLAVSMRSAKASGAPEFARLSAVCAELELDELFLLVRLERRLPTPPAARMAFSFSSSFRCLLAMLSDSDDAVTLEDELLDDDDAKMA